MTTFRRLIFINLATVAAVLATAVIVSLCAVDPLRGPGLLAIVLIGWLIYRLIKTDYTACGFAVVVPAVFSSRLFLAAAAYDFLVGFQPQSFDSLVVSAWQFLLFGICEVAVTFYLAKRTRGSAAR